MSAATALSPMSPASAPPVGAPKARAGQVSDNVRRWRKGKSALVSGMCMFCTLLVITPLGLVLGYLFYKGIGSLDWNFFTHTPVPTGEVGGGVANAIVGTFELIGIASAIGVPVGVFGAIYLTEYGNVKFNSIVRFAADVLNGVPSIVWGIVAYELIVSHDITLFGHVLKHKGFSALAGGVALAFIMIPLVLRTTEEVLLLVPSGYREAGLALGISRWHITMQIVVKTALKGIVTGVVLAVARVAGETAPLLFTALGNTYWNRSLSEPISALPLQIFSYAISPYEDQNRQAWAAALVLILLVLGLNVTLRHLTRGKVAPAR